MNVTMFRGEMIEKLKKNLLLAKAENAKTKIEHQKAEQVYLKAFRDALKRGLAWDYKKAKEKGFEVDYRETEGEKPSCPESEAKKIAGVLNALKIDVREKISFQDNDQIDVAVLWLPKSDRTPSSLCVED